MQKITNPFNKNSNWVILENVAYENLSTFSETMSNHSAFGPGKIENDIEDRERKKERNRRGKERLRNLLLLYWQL